MNPPLQRPVTMAWTQKINAWPVLAGILSFILPGSGQAFNNAFQKACVHVASYLLLAIALPVIRHSTPPRGAAFGIWFDTAAALIWIVRAFRIYSAIDAIIWAARRSSRVETHPITALRSGLYFFVGTFLIYQAGTAALLEPLLQRHPIHWYRYLSNEMPGLIRALENRQWPQVQTALRILGDHPRGTSPVVPALTRSALRDPDETNRRAAMNTLIRTEPRSPRVLHTLIDALEDPNPQNRDIAMDHLVQTANNSAPLLCGSLIRPNPALRLAVLRTLSRMHLSRAQLAEPIQPALHDQHYEIRAEARQLFQEAR